MGAVACYLSRLSGIVLEVGGVMDDEERKARQVEIMLGAKVGPYLEQQVEKLMVCRFGLPSPAGLEVFLRNVMREIGVEYDVQPVPPSQDGRMRATVYYKVAEGELMWVEVCLVDTVL